MSNFIFGGCNTVELAQTYGTPLYVMDEEAIRRNCRIYKNSIDAFYNGGGMILYASKALSAKFMYRIANEEGLGVDVASGGELFTALAADFPPEKIYFHGNNKTRDELAMALDNNVGRIVVDNIYELMLLDEVAAEKGVVPKILFRIKPGVEAHTHEFVKVGGIDSKFGIPLEHGEAMEFVRRALSLSNVELVGVHAHIGSQIFDYAPFELAALKLFNFMCEARDKFGVTLTELNLGGGYGIKYTQDDNPISYDKYMEYISVAIKSAAKRLDFPLPYVLMEPGRSIVGDAGVTLYTVGGIKDIKGVRKYISVDGGMADNPRYTMYGAKYAATVANRADAPPAEVVTVAGRCCETDTLIKDISLPEISVGDILAVHCTGAYNYALSSNYNKLPRPAMVLVSNGKHRVVVRRESYEDLIKNEE